MLEARVSKWIANRFETKAQFKLGHQQLFIFPTKFGFLYLLVVLVIFVLGTNYQNNPILLLSYFLFFMFVWSLHACFNNMIRCQFDGMSVKDGYVGESTELKIKVTKANDAYTPTQLSFCHDSQAVLFDYGDLQSNLLKVFIPLTHRGQQQPHILKVKSEYPFGLVQAWSYLRFDTSFWVYPKPIKGDWQFTTIQHVIDYHKQSERTGNQSDDKEQSTDKSGGQQSLSAQSDSSIPENISVDRQFDGIKTFVPGSPMSQVAWKQFAKQTQGELLLKDFIDEQQTDVALTLSSIKQGKLEEKLSTLTQAVLDLHQQKQPFLLDLSGYRGHHEQIQYTGDEASFQQCLRALARFGLSKPRVDHSEQGS